MQGGLPLQVLAAELLEAIVVAGVGGELAVLHVDDAVHRAVQQAAVVGDQQESAGIALQKAFQPERGFEVEVVGRLVEQQQVGGLEQEGGESHPHAPAAGELGAGALLGSLVEARSEEHTSELQSLMRISYADFCLKKK